MSPEYPTDQELFQIAAWPHTDPEGWFAFIRRAGNYWGDPEPWGWTEHGGSVGERDDEIEDDPASRYYEISTGGWSGNESLLGAMRRNVPLWRLTWVMNRRGGHYRFRTGRSKEP